MSKHFEQVIKDLENFRTHGGSVTNKEQVLADEQLVQSLKKVCKTKEGFSRIIEQTWQKHNPEIKVK